MKKTLNETKKIEINGITFVVGHQCDEEFSGLVFMIYKNGKGYGALSVNSVGDEFGWQSGIFATEEDIEAIKIAKTYL